MFKKIHSYTDTVTTSAKVLRDKRKRINKTAFYGIVMFFVVAFESVGLYLLGLKVTSLFIGVFSLSLVVIFVGLIVKRELYSIMIFLKEKK